MMRRLYIFDMLSTIPQFSGFNMEAVNYLDIGDWFYLDFTLIIRIIHSAKFPVDNARDCMQEIECWWIGENVWFQVILPTEIYQFAVNWKWN